MKKSNLHKKQTIFRKDRNTKYKETRRTLTNVNFP